ncbi:MAG: 2TM domain-containing protein [Pricia sp.]
MRQWIKEVGNALLIGTLIYLIILVILFFSGKLDNGFSLNIAWREYYGNLIPSLILYFANLLVFRFFGTDSEGNFYTTKILLQNVIAHFVVSVLGIFLARGVVIVGMQNVPMTDFLRNERFSEYYVSLFITAVVLVIFYAFYYYKYRQENKVKEQKIIAGTASAKFDALKNQLDPHFLFNSLTVLTSLIEENPHQAQKFTTSLSKVYRYVLEQKNKDLVSVDEELQFAKTYVRLLKMRFEDSIIFDIPETSQNPNAKIVPLSLQLLLENAVKHNVVTAERPLHIQVSEENGMLVVRNNLQEKQTVRKSSGVGLHNIRQRYGILTDRTVDIEKTATDFRVGVPILSQQISVMETQKEYLADKRYEKAKERVEAIKGFYGNLLAYCVVIPCLAFVNYKTTSFSFPWVLFPILGWGFGLTMHGMEAFGYNPLWGKRWEEKKMREFMEDDSF